MSRTRLVAILAILGIATYLATGSFYTVSEVEQAIITQFGRPVGDPVTTAGLKLKVGDNDVVTIPAAELKSVESAPSGMPEVAAFVLTKSEIRDVVAYLAALQKPAESRATAPLRALRKAEDN